MREGRWGKLRCEAVTVFTWLGEGEDGQARYRATCLDGVACFARRGLRQHPLQAARGDCAAQVYLFEDTLRRARRAFVAGDVYAGMDEAARGGVWTAREQGRDWVALGMYGDGPLPPQERRWRVTGVEVRDQGSRAVRHVRLSCE